MAHDPAQANALVIPIQLIGHSDILRVIRELESVEDFYTQAELKNNQDVPTFSQTLDAIIRENKINLHFRKDRVALGDALIYIRDNAPQIHISFATEPDAQFIQKIAGWFREKIDPHALIQTGIQPSIAAGCVVRTTNMYFDFSLRQHLMRNSNLLLEELKALA